MKRIIFIICVIAACIYSLSVRSESELPLRVEGWVNNNTFRLNVGGNGVNNQNQLIAQQSACLVALDNARKIKRNKLAEILAVEGIKLVYGETSSKEVKKELIDEISTLPFEYTWDEGERTFDRSTNIYRCWFTFRIYMDGLKKNLQKAVKKRY